MDTSVDRDKDRKDRTMACVIQRTRTDKSHTIALLKARATGVRPCLQHKTRARRERYMLVDRHSGLPRKRRCFPTDPDLL